MQFKQKPEIMKKLLCLFCICVALNTEGYAQNRFRATAICGLNLSQIDGDLQQGYRKKDMCIGLSSAYIFRPDFDISLEAFYSPRGAKPAPLIDSKEDFYRTNIALKYADIATMFSFYAYPHKSKLYYIQTLKVGVSYGRLLRSDIDMRRQSFRNTEYEKQISNALRKDDVSIIVGAAWQFTPQLGLMIRHTSSLRRIYDKREVLTLGQTSSIPQSNKNIPYLSPYNFSIQVFYHFLSPHKVIGTRIGKKGIGESDPLEEL
jgi:hypothetical protein